jgi:uncharacterized protein (DUF3820 family)
MFSVPPPPTLFNGSPGDERLPFGKHKGQRVADVPQDYLHWLLDSPRTSAGLKKTISAFLEIDVAEDATEPEPVTAAVALPYVTWLWSQEMNKRYLLDDAARKVVADGEAVLKRICTTFANKQWAEGGAA